MKFKYFFILPILLISLDAIAQHAYFQIGGGYAFPTFNRQSHELISTGPDGAVLIRNAGSDLGAGVPLTVRAGYMINNFVGADIGFNYLIGNNNSINKNEFESFSEQTRQARLNPAIVFSTNRDMILSAYARVGLVLPLGGVTTTREEISATLSETGLNTTYEAELRNRFGVGYSGTLGAQYRVYERMFLFAEVESIHLAINKKSQRITSAIIGDNDQTNQMMRYELETRYVNELTSLSNNVRTNPSFNENAPLDILTNTRFFNSVGMNIGIKYRIY